ncbi:GPP34 family phosphoprotein [Streptomyces sp. LX-29]|uniref:GOLPH3/VPS74 family protein n=1 Tax=Streptomyces sp. LX-29 TaxID=2900152 RepID=UPI00240D3E42|nr:GPP34 family phosphoprotein [Streptomyces sp. LX-29]WFB09984.1 GPP34 family phosphoprotein [Streptomyces sp. LX-29]
MTTPRDLMITAMDVAPGRAVGRGELSLALAGAELIDLLAAGAVSLDGDRILPGHRTTIADRLLDQAAASLDREAPYESVDDWLWRRGRDLASAYLSVLEAEGVLTRRRRWMPLRSGEPVLVESGDRRAAGDRWAWKEPVLVLLATAAGIRDEETGVAPGVVETPDVVDDTVAAVLAAVHDAVTELEAERQRRAIEQAAFDNVWRGD